VQLVETGLGLFLVALVFWDAFETIVVPRPTPGWFRIARYVIRTSWRLVRGSGRGGTTATRDRLIGLFAPAVIVLLLVTWLAALILGYGLILLGLGDQLQPAPTDLGTAMYFAASSILTIGYGDIVAVGELARIVVVAAAASGLGIVALVITFLFSLFASYQRREVSVVLLQAKAGVPPSAVVLLETLARMDLYSRLPEMFGDWERWAAEVLDSHVAYPLLVFFRSSHDNLSWVSALGTILDTATLVLTTILDVQRGSAELFKSVGSHLVEDITNLGFRSGEYEDIDRLAFDAVYSRLAAAGYRLIPSDAAWEAFSAARQTYAPRLAVMAAYLAVPSASWFGGREELRSPTHRRAGAVAGSVEDRIEELT